MVYKNNKTVNKQGKCRGMLGFCSKAAETAGKPRQGAEMTWHLKLQCECNATSHKSFV